MLKWCYLIVLFSIDWSYLIKDWEKSTGFGIKEKKYFKDQNLESLVLKNKILTYYEPNLIILFDLNTF